MMYHWLRPDDCIRRSFRRLDSFTWVAPRTAWTKMVHCASAGTEAGAAWAWGAAVWARGAAVGAAPGAGAAADRLSVVRWAVGGLLPPHEAHATATNKTTTSFSLMGVSPLAEQGDPVYHTFP